VGAKGVCEVFKKILLEFNSKIDDNIRCNQTHIELRGEDNKWTSFSVHEADDETLAKWINYHFQNRPRIFLVVINALLTIALCTVLWGVEKIFLRSRYLSDILKKLRKMFRRNGGSRKKIAKKKTRVSWTKNTRSKTQKQNALLKSCNLRL
jgi:hypothetical protein